MKATEIVEKLKSVLLSAEEPKEVELAEEQVENLEVEAEEVKEDEVELAEEGEDVPSEEAPAEESQEEMKYATKEELEGALAEMRAMYQELRDKMGSEEMEVEVPSEEPIKEELSSQVEEVEPISHSPEAVETKPNLNINLAQRRPMSTLDRVFSQINSIKK